MQDKSRASWGQQMHSPASRLRSSADSLASLIAKQYFATILTSPTQCPHPGSMADYGSSYHWPCWSLLRLLQFQARLAQSVERKALNLVVVGSSPTVGVYVPCSVGIISSDGPSG